MLDGWKVKSDDKPRAPCRHHQEVRSGDLTEVGEQMLCKLIQ